MERRRYVVIYTCTAQACHCCVRTIRSKSEVLMAALRPFLRVGEREGADLYCHFPRDEYVELY